VKLARIRNGGPGGGPLVVIRGTADAAATVDGRSYGDLPELLDAAGGDLRAIEPGSAVSVRDEDLLAVVARPHKIICVGLNYRAHAEESNAEIPRHPVLFPKWDNAIAGPFEAIVLPPESRAVDWESELAFVFARRCRRVKAEDAASVVFGFTAANDVSMRDFQFHTSQWAPGKAWDGAMPVGPVLVSEDELGGVRADLSIRGLLNGTTMQDSRTNDLIFDVPHLVEYITTIMTVEPGDIVLTGTPAGVGQGQKPPLFLKPGDVYEVAIEGIGGPRNRFVSG
jgi:acylpyruvate hydrolase